MRAMPKRSSRKQASTNDRTATRSPATGAYQLGAVRKVDGKARSGSATIAWRKRMMERAFSEALATEGTEFTERFALSPSTRQPLLQPGCVEMGKNVRLCVLGDLCGRTFLTSGRPKRSMAKLDRGRGRYRSRYRNRKSVVPPARSVPKRSHHSQLTSPFFSLPTDRVLTRRFLSS